MSIVEVKVPQFSESVSEGTLMEWNKQIVRQFLKMKLLSKLKLTK